MEKVIRTIWIESLWNESKQWGNVMLCIETSTGKQFFEIGHTNNKADFDDYVERAKAVIE